jgi:hypothetical protein
MMLVVQVKVNINMNSQLYYYPSASISKKTTGFESGLAAAHLGGVYDIFYYVIKQLYYSKIMNNNNNPVGWLAVGC